MQVNAFWVHAGVCQINFSAQTLFDVFAKFHFQQLPKVTLTHIPLQAPLGPQFLQPHCTLVVAFGRPGALEGPRCDICHILHIMPLQNRNRSIVKYSLFSKVCICRPLLVSLPLPLAIYLYLEKYYLDPHSEYIIFF